MPKKILFHKIDQDCCDVRDKYEQGGYHHPLLSEKETAAALRDYRRDHEQNIDVQELVYNDTGGAVGVAQLLHTVNTQLVYKEMEHQHDSQGHPSVHLNGAEAEPDITQVIIGERYGNDEMRQAMEEHPAHMLALEFIDDVELQGEISQQMPEQETPEDIHSEFYFSVSLMRPSHSCVGAAAA